MGKTLTIDRKTLREVRKLLREGLHPAEAAVKALKKAAARAGFTDADLLEFDRATNGRTT